MTMAPVPGSAGESVDGAALQRRTLHVLRVVVVPGWAAVAGSVAVVSLLAKDLLGSDRFAGLASATFTSGAAFTAIPLAAFMARRGRRPGMVAALLVGAAGAVVAAAGGQVRWFPLFLAGMFLFGAGQAATLMARYVATDLARENDRGRAIGAIVWIGALGAVFGPLLTPVARQVGEWLGLDTYVGPYLFAAGLFAAAAALCALLLRPDPLRVRGGVDPGAPRVRPLLQVRRSLGVILASPGASLGLVAMAGSQAAMVAVMTMTPPHMDDHGHADLSAFVIAVHILGMFGLAPVVGRLVDRVGAVRGCQLGAVVLGAGTVTSVAAGYVPALLFVGLFLLGLGWNLGLISGSSLLSAWVPTGTRVEAQGTGDLTLSLCGAAAALASGFVKAGAGFHVLAHLATVVAAGMLAYAMVAKRRVARVDAGALVASPAAAAPPG